MRKYLVLAGVLAGMTLLAAGSAVLAAGGGGGFGAPGTTTYTDLSANAYVGDSSGSWLSIYVDRGMQTFKLRGVSGPPEVVGPETVLNVYGHSQSSGYVYGCFVIPDSSFTVAPRLATASLNVDPSQETACPGILVPAGAGGRPGIESVTPDAGGGGGAGGTPIAVNLVWTSNGAVTSFNLAATSSCQTSVSHVSSTSQNTFASLSGSVAGFEELTAIYAAIDETDSVDTITSQFSDACTGA